MEKFRRRALIFLLSCSLTVLGALLVAAVVAGVCLLQLDTELDESLMEFSGNDKTTRLYYKDENGEMRELSADRISGYENALYCPLSEMSVELQEAFVAIEDKRFFEHGGIDWIRTGHAVREYLLHGHSGFGGSTITQQLVKNLTGESERSVSRKAAELIRAARLEQRYTKEEILEEYLNIVNLAENCYGVRTAANAYFSKEPSQLTLAEAAAIAAITNNPSRYDPVYHPEANRARRDLILGEMLAQGRINEAAYLEAVGSDTDWQIDRSAMSDRVNSWYADLVVQDVIRALVEEKGMSAAQASRLVYCGGLRIETCVNPRLQKLLEEYYRDEGHFPKQENGKRAESSMMIVDPRTGDILALVGSIGEKSSNRVQNFATDTRRPSGSVIKPLSVYAPALERDLITYGSVFDDVPRSYRQSGAPWPRNSPNIYRGLTTVNDALTHSVNTVSVAVLERLGSAASYRFLRDKLEMRSLGQEDMSAAALALGQQYHGLTLRELLGGYTALAGDGIFRGTRSFTAVYDRDGELLLSSGVREKRVLSEETAAIMTMMLRHVVQSGTGRSLNLKATVDVAGKTGTSSNSYDKWFIGYTPELLAGVWCGYEYPEALASPEGNPALRIFDTLMERAVAVRGVRERLFRTPTGVIPVWYCKDSGALLSDPCAYDPRGDRSEIGYFKRGTEPAEECHCHVLIDYCEGCGVSNGDCPVECRHPVALLRVMREFPRQIHVLDAAYTYGGYAREKGLSFTDNEPYYAIKQETKRFFGIGMDEVPYNRACPGHALCPEQPPPESDADGEFWERRQGA